MWEWARRIVAVAGAVVLVVLAGCKAPGLPISGASATGTVQYSHDPETVVLTYRTVAPYNPTSTPASDSGPELTVYGDGRYTGRLDGATRTGSLTEAELTGLLQGMWDAGLFDDPDLGGRVYDAGESWLRATANGQETELVISGMSQSLPAVEAVRETISELYRLTS